MKMEIEIRRATPEDAVALALLMRLTFDQAFGEVWTNKRVLHGYLDTTFAVSKIRNSLSKPNNGFWLACRDEFPVGYCKVKFHSPNESLGEPAPAQLQKIYVLQDFIGRKIGEALQEAMLNELKAIQINRVWLAVWDGNVKGIRFYERHGWVKAARYRYDFEEMGFDYELMVKEVRA